MFCARYLLLADLVCATADGQTIYTSAGLPHSHRASVDSKPALNAPLNAVCGLLFDRVTGRLLFHDQQLVERLEPDGSLLALAGFGSFPQGAMADGTIASNLQIG